LEQADLTRARHVALTIFKQEAPHQQTLRFTNAGNAKLAAAGSEAKTVC